MTKKELKVAVETAKAETREVLETMYNGLSKTKREKLETDEKVRKVMGRHGARREK